MDNMSLFDAVVVGVPEVFLIYLTSIVIIKGNIFKSKDASLKIIIKILLISIIYPLMLIIIRRNISNFIIIGTISLLFAIIVLKFVFQFNIRQALIGGYLGVFTIMFCEIFSMPIINLMRVKYSGYYFDYRFIFSIPTRIFQIIALYICFRFNLKSNDLLNLRWNLLSKSKKMTFYSIILLFGANHLFGANYTEIFIKANLYDIDIRKIFFNIQVFYVEAVAFMIVALILLSRTMLYEDYRDILGSPKKAFEALLYNSSEGEIHYYINITKDYLNVIGIDRVEEILKRIKESRKGFHYHIDKKLGLTGYNFKKIYLLLELLYNRILREVITENTIVTLELNEDIRFNLKIVLNDIEKRRLVKMFEQDLGMENLKFSLVDEGSEYQITKEKYFELDIRIPHEFEVKDEDL
ncbi:hypothetical protein R9X47_15620 [Wukongibacter baidiensis]|uniref:hypothetical protein n=1 Tax=Wukongibacter baidiensis TaxID=1723361 RepID=UPI003D7F477F